MGAHARRRSRTALHVIHLERSLGAFFEPGFQQAFLNHQWVIDLANWMYFNSHFVITTAFLVWLYLFRNDNFNFVRNMFLVAMGLALVGYALFPTAPPRMFPGAGFTDTIAAFTNTNQDSSFTSLLVNPYAAVPSMHIAFSLMVAVPAMNLVRSAWARALWSAYPLVGLLRDRRDREPLLVRRRRAAPRWPAWRRSPRISSRGCAPTPGRGATGASTKPRPEPRLRASPDRLASPAWQRRFRAAQLRDVRTAEEFRAYARGRLIESRLTPNAISLTGFDPQPRRRRAGDSSGCSSSPASRSSSAR